jgi:hypothetical protein
MALLYFWKRNQYMAQAVPNDAPQTWNPVDAVKQKFPNMGLSDQQIYHNLSEPEKFRSAFPEYSGLKDDEIRTNMQRIGLANPHYRSADTYAEPGLLDRADKAITDTLEANPKNLQSATRTNLIEVPKTLGREVYSGAKTALGIIPGVYHALADEATPEERAQYADSEKEQGEAPGTETSGFKRIGLGLERLVRDVTDPTVEAAKDYARGRVGYQDILENAPEALGQGAGTVLGAKLLEEGGTKANELGSAIKKNVPPPGDVVRGFKPIKLEADAFSDVAPESKASFKARTGFQPKINTDVETESGLDTNAPRKPINVKGPGEIQPETIGRPLVDEEAPRPTPGRKTLAGNQGTMGSMLALPESTSESQPLIPEASSDLEKTLQETKAAVAPAVKAASTKSLIEDIGEGIRKGAGGSELKSDVPLKEQLNAKSPTASAKTEEKFSSDPRKAVLQKAGASPEDIEKILVRGTKTDPTSKVGLSKLAQHFDVDLVQAAIGRGKGDIAAGTHMAPADVLKKIVDAGHSPADIAKAVDEGKHLPTTESASKLYRIDTRRGTALPISSEEAKDIGDHDEIVSVDSKGNQRTVARGSKAEPRLKSSKLVLQ